MPGGKIRRNNFQTNLWRRSLRVVSTAMNTSSRERRTVTVGTRRTGVRDRVRRVWGPTEMRHTAERCRWRRDWAPLPPRRSGATVAAAAVMRYYCANRRRSFSSARRYNTTIVSCLSHIVR